MIERAFVRIDGPAGHGKTTFIEHILTAYDDTAIVARGEPSDKKRFREHCPKRDSELKRYRQAGAGAVTRLYCPRGDDFSDDFFMSDFMQNYSEAVLIEGPGPDTYYKRLVWVARPPADGGRLLIQQTYDRIAESRAAAAATRLEIEKPGGVEEYLKKNLGELLAEAMTRQPAEVEKIRNEMLILLAKHEQQAGHDHAEHWTLAAGYEDIVKAQMVVAALHDEADRANAETFIADLHRLRSDKEVFETWRGVHGTRIPITALAANLTDPHDPGTKKAVRRILRDLKRGD